MSIKVTSWALNEAPVDEPVLVLVLVAMAERANDDGTATWQSVETIARKARISPRTCHRRLRELEDLGLIRRGNQEFTAHLRAGYRPVVYDLAVHLNRGAKLAHLPDGGVPNTTLRGAKSSTSGVPLLADNSSYDSSIDSLGLFEAPAKVSRSKKQKTTVPERFHVTNDMEGWAIDNVQGKGISVGSETNKFLNYHKAKGTVFVDWEAAWRNWMLKAVEFASLTGNGKKPPQPAQANNGRRLGIDYSIPETDDVYTASNRAR